MANTISQKDEFDIALEQYFAKYSTMVEDNRMNANPMIAIEAKTKFYPKHSRQEFAILNKWIGKRFLSWFEQYALNVVMTAGIAKALSSVIGQTDPLTQQFCDGAIGLLTSMGIFYYGDMRKEIEDLSELYLHIKFIRLSMANVKVATSFFIGRDYYKKATNNYHANDSILFMINTQKEFIDNILDILMRKEMNIVGKLGEEKIKELDSSFNMKGFIEKYGFARQ